jgi:hypothetical protein
MKPLDIVNTPSDNLAIIQQIRSDGQVMVHYLDETIIQQYQWWEKHELKVVNSLPRILAIMSSVTETGRDTAEQAFPKE